MVCHSLPRNKIGLENKIISFAVYIQVVPVQAKLHWFLSKACQTLMPPGHGVFFLSSEPDAAKKKLRERERSEMFRYVVFNTGMTLLLMQA